MTNSDILEISLKQSALDLNCCPEDFFRDAPVVVLSRKHPDARRYLKLPFECNLVSYGSNVVASVSQRAEAAVREYLQDGEGYDCFKTPKLHRLDESLAAMGLMTRHMAEYFLPDMITLRPLSCRFDLRLMGPEDFSDLYVPAWSNALCADRRHLDVIGLGAYDGDRKSVV